MGIQNQYILDEELEHLWMSGISVGDRFKLG